MISITATSNAKQVLAAMRKAERQVPFAMAKALTLSGMDARAHVVERVLPSVFDRPTPFTLNSLRLFPATKDKLEARLDFRNPSNGKEHYLWPQVRGGDRRLKRLEQRLVHAGYMRANEIVVPAAGARLDSYGNVSRGQIGQILSQLKAQDLQGDFSGATNSRRSKAKRAREAYFVSFGKGDAEGLAASLGIRNPTQHLPRGVWLRRNFGPMGSAVKPVLLFVPKPVDYKPRFHFQAEAAAIARKQFPLRFRQTFADAVKTGRLAEQTSLF